MCTMRTSRHEHRATVTHVFLLSNRSLFELGVPDRCRIVCHCSEELEIATELLLLSSPEESVGAPIGHDESAPSTEHLLTQSNSNAVAGIVLRSLEYSLQ